ncbi:hypothetical protein Gotri_024480 [Gossypium trilobum]|uniref:Uncharacterized protein n=1 Tax=Gossypium trilobum TaxID=34281 RepID=A0A7J9DNA7_9ROSI|nr:hypothetical protein [Gossypium trilobum]
MDAKMMFPWMRWISRLQSQSSKPNQDGSTFSNKEKKYF